jgi:glycosyltransferase involved in cell wall biosynthesis
MPGVRAVTNAAHRYGVVAIGRNEGERLRACLESLDPTRAPLVYVDSDSTDDSVALAAAMGAEVVRLDLSTPFTAARARNEGFDRLQRIAPEIEFVQFVDGDCDYFPAWFDVAARTLQDDPTIAAVTGMQRERRPEATLYNLLCDVEWTGVVGDIDTFAGNVMVRAQALRDTERVTGGLYNPDLIAGEDPEFSIRVRKATGLRLVRVDEPMCLHDVDMTKLSQWWKRNVRAGHAYAQVSGMHGDAPLRFWKKEARSNWLWGAALPIAAAPLLPPAYVALFWRVYRHARGRGLDARAARVYAFFTTVGKVPQALGQAKFMWNRLRGVKSTLIEYKGPEP